MGGQNFTIAGPTYCAYCKSKDIDVEVTVDVAQFCSITCKALWLKEHRLGRFHWLRREDGSMNYGRNYQEMREKVINRDKNCQMGGCNADPSEVVHEVHHITPIDSFFFPEEANTMDNMIYLCKQHHCDVEAGKVASPRPDAEME